MGTKRTIAPGRLESGINASLHHLRPRKSKFMYLCSQTTM
jgi:hypothetical protein